MLSQVMLRQCAAGDQHGTDRSLLLLLHVQHPFDLLWRHVAERNGRGAGDSPVKDLVIEDCKKFVGVEVVQSDGYSTEPLDAFELFVQSPQHGFWTNDAHTNEILTEQRDPRFERHRWWKLIRFGISRGFRDISHRSHLPCDVIPAPPRK